MGKNIEIKKLEEQKQKAIERLNDETPDYKQRQFQPFFTKFVAQYSMSHVKELLDRKIRIPILSASLASATRCKTFLESDG